ncbi:predicted protein [Sclerotinia sclerotiorum 1980 UF-70]|uniref:Uncharacterized protein n=1 Tax=Sclerotinia sclerotiorum (strain ATCC 18683 / 1980 / Ss-1) TaxID=665079 RepID=A7EUT8_SCLS1|nr:predicted protein [Sclerotinia sclerotiorum 1980 UF-70]EDN93230.1 predicted protein [Sclerotinia sclerotiorum 1980 UF-70]
MAKRNTEMNEVDAKMKACTGRIISSVLGR